MDVIKMAEVEGTVNSRGVMAKKLIKHAHTTVMNLILKPGDIVPEHAVPVDVFFYIVKGKGTLLIGDDKKVVIEQDIILCPPNTVMALWADQGEEFVVLNVKTPSL